MVQDRKSLMEQGVCETLDVKHASKTYQKPLLKIYGDVRHLTQGTVSKNGMVGRV